MQGQCYIWRINSRRCVHRRVLVAIRGEQFDDVFPAGVGFELCYDKLFKILALSYNTRPYKHAPRFGCVSVVDLTQCFEAHTELSANRTHVVGLSVLEARRKTGSSCYPCRPASTYTMIRRATQNHSARLSVILFVTNIAPLRMSSLTHRYPTRGHNKLSYSILVNFRHVRDEACSAGVLPPTRARATTAAQAAAVSGSNGSGNSSGSDNNNSNTIAHFHSTTIWLETYVSA